MFAYPTTNAAPSRRDQPIGRIIAWREAAGLLPRMSATFNIFHSDPETTDPADYRLDLCAATDRPIAANAAGW